MVNGPALQERFEAPWYVLQVIAKPIRGPDAGNSGGQIARADFKKPAQESGRNQSPFEQR